ncbi:MAG TPA: helix-turn-helix domain-containing protein [Cellvibrio sp.]|nr:helix-turn-helix domain-containing protein [Cellvibrio sp.]
MLSHTISLLFFAAAMQGFFLATILGLQRRNSQANHILSLWIGLLSLDLLQQIYYIEALYLALPQFINLINLLPLTYGGFLFLYVRSLTQTTPLSRRDLLHFTFFFIGLLASIPFMLQSGDEKLELVTRMMEDQSPRSLAIFSLVMPLVASVYAWLAYRLMLRHKRAGNTSLGWLRLMLLLNMVIWALVWLLIFIPHDLHRLDNIIIYALVSLVIYLMGYFSLRQPEITPAEKITPITDSSAQIGLKYGDNRLPDELREAIRIELEKYIDNKKLWRASNLNLAQLTEHTGIASHHISQVLNDHLGLSFNDYLNQYRVKDVCAQLVTAGDQNLLDVALACGFSSKSSFNAIFKKHTGQTPSEYRKQVQSQQIARPELE